MLSCFIEQKYWPLLCSGGRCFSGAAFGQSIEGTVRGSDGKALKDAEVRVEGKDKKGGHDKDRRSRPLFLRSTITGPVQSQRRPGRRRHNRASM